MLVDETDIGKVAVGQPARVTVEAYPNRVFHGEIFKIEPRAIVEQNVTMFPVLVHLDNREGLLKPGMNAEVEVEIARRDDAIAVPNAAVVAMRDVAAASEVLGLDPDIVRNALRSGARRGSTQNTSAEAQPAAGEPGNSAPRWPLGSARAVAPARSATPTVPGSASAWSGGASRGGRGGARGARNVDGGCSRVSSSSAVRRAPSPAPSCSASTTGTTPRSSAASSPASKSS